MRYIYVQICCTARQRLPYRRIVRHVQGCRTYANCTTCPRLPYRRPIGAIAVKVASKWRRRYQAGNVGTHVGSPEHRRTAVRGCSAIEKAQLPGTAVQRVTMLQSKRKRKTVISTLRQTSQQRPSKVRTPGHERCGYCVRGPMRNVSLYEENLAPNAPNPRRTLALNRLGLALSARAP